MREQNSRYLWVIESEGERDDWMELHVGGRWLDLPIQVCMRLSVSVRFTLSYDMCGKPGAYIAVY